MRRTCAALLLALACASPGEPVAPGTSQVFGELRLVPREGVTPGGGHGAYGDRRLRDVAFVDYERPGFAVVYAPEESPPRDHLVLAIRDTRFGLRIEPAEAAVGAGGVIAIRNESRLAHVLSHPAAGLVRELPPGAGHEIAVPRAGEQGVYLLDVPDVSATVFAAPGPFAVTSPAGHFTLGGLAPGLRELRAWHPRFPPAALRVELAPGTRQRVEFELGVGLEGGAARAE